MVDKMTNGDLTRKILKAAHALTGKPLLEEAKRLMRKFPLSSDKLLYDKDKFPIPLENWKILIQAAIETDGEKAAIGNRLMVEAGGKPIFKSFGRWKKKNR